MGILDELEQLPLYERRKEEKRMAEALRGWGYNADALDPPEEPAAPAAPPARAAPPPSKRAPGEVDSLRDAKRSLSQKAGGAIRSALGLGDDKAAGNEGGSARGIGAVKWLSEKTGRKISDEEFEKGRKRKQEFDNSPFSVWLRDARASAQAQADSPENLGLLGEIGLLTQDEQKAWLKGERIAADRSLTSRQESLQRANASADIFSQGAPGKPIHPWISERQRFGQTAVADAEARQARVGEMERGERPPAKKSAWRSLIENSTSGVVSGATKVTMVAEAIGEVGQTSMEAAGYRPEDAEQSKVLPGVVVELGELIADKVTALFPGDPARRDEATQILAKRAAQMLATVGGASAASAWRDITGAQSDRRRLWWRTNECLPTMGTHEHIYVL